MRQRLFDPESGCRTKRRKVGPKVGPKAGRRPSGVGRVQNAGKWAENAGLNAERPTPGVGRVQNAGKGGRNAGPDAGCPAPLLASLGSSGEARARAREGREGGPRGVPRGKGAVEPPSNPDTAPSAPPNPPPRGDWGAGDGPGNTTPVTMPRPTTRSRSQGHPPDPGGGGPGSGAAAPAAAATPTSKTRGKKPSEQGGGAAGGPAPQPAPTPPSPPGVTGAGGQHGGGGPSSGDIPPPILEDPLQVLQEAEAALLEQTKAGASNLSAADTLEWRGKCADLFAAWACAHQQVTGNTSLNPFLATGKHMYVHPAAGVSGEGGWWPGDSDADGGEGPYSGWARGSGPCLSCSLGVNVATGDGPYQPHPLGWVHCRFLSGHPEATLEEFLLRLDLVLKLERLFYDMYNSEGSGPWNEKLKAVGDELRRRGWCTNSGSIFTSTLRSGAGPLQGEAQGPLSLADLTWRLTTLQGAEVYFTFSRGAPKRRSATNPWDFLSSCRVTDLSCSRQGGESMDQSTNKANERRASLLIAVADAMDLTTNFKSKALESAPTRPKLVRAPPLCPLPLVLGF